MTKRRGLEADPLGDTLSRNRPRGLDALIPTEATEEETAPEEETTDVQEAAAEPPAEKPIKRPTQRSTDKQTSQSTDLSTARLTGQLTDQSIDSPHSLQRMLAGATDSGQPLRRPVAFYLTEQQDEALTILVEHFRRAHRVKTDRSALLRAILKPPVLDFYNEDTHTEIIARLSDDATRRLVGWTTDQSTARLTS